MTDLSTKEIVVMSENNSERVMPQIIWDDSEIVNSYANVCNVMGTREEMMILFGTNQGVISADQKEVKVKLSNRIVLNPYAAKRLQQLLEIGLKEYESRYGELKL
jgi:hypothetical protein